MVVRITDINETKGKIYVALYNSENLFLKEPAAHKVIAAIKGEASVEFEDLPFGEYAVSAIHDLDENGKLDKNFLGIPREGFGFMDGAMGTFGPPSFEKVKFGWKGIQDTKVIPMKYF